MDFEWTRRRRQPGYETRVVLFALLAALPWIALTIIFIVVDPPRDLAAILIAAGTIATLVALALLRSHLTYPLRTLSNLVASIREEDYSFRARGARGDDALGEVLLEINELGTDLREQRLGAREATALVRKVINELESAIFTFDGEQRLRLVNRSAATLLAQNPDQLAGRTATELGLAGLLEVDEPVTIERTFPGRTGRWSVNHSTFRETGRRHDLLVVTDVSRALREEERQAWQRLLRVIGHELNNSLAPIMSIAASLEATADRDPRPADFQEDLCRGLGIISSRAEGLRRFMDAYSRLARVPEPKLGAVDLRPLVQRIAELEQRRPVRVNPGPDVTVQADAAQIEQVLINLLRNAVDAAEETDGAVSIGWDRSPHSVSISVRDEGAGISGRSNLFVPFFTTKPGGTGIGLVLSRQIAEAHRGTLTLENQPDRGCVARLTLPLV
jgi:two-component system, NtrC family, nitrogen regulation sensor histidine kinase NtrY